MKKMKFWCALILLGLVMLRPEQAVAGAQRAMRLWFGAVAPALFPFLVLMPVLTGSHACRIYDRALSSIMGPVFALPGSAAPAVIIGMIAGSPGGAIAVAGIAARSGMPAYQARRIALAVCGLSPAYLVIGVGQGLMGSAVEGWKLAAVQACIQVFLLLILRFLPSEREQCANMPAHDVPLTSISSAVETVLGICGYMVFFSIIASAAASIIGDVPGRLLLMVMDLPSGLPSAIEWRSPLLMGAAIGFCGLCIGMQNLDALRAISVRAKHYFAVRILCAVLFSGAYSLVKGADVHIRTADRLPIRAVFAFSVLCALACMIPPLILFSEKYVLNKRKIAENRPVSR